MLIWDYVGNTPIAAIASYTSKDINNTATKKVGAEDVKNVVDKVYFLFPTQDERINQDGKRRGREEEEKRKTLTIGKSTSNTRSNTCNNTHNNKLIIIRVPFALR